jgi:hypothetical protein
LKLKLKGRRFDTIEKIEAESQRLLDTDRKEFPGNVSKMEDTVETGVYMQEGTTSRMVADSPYCEFYDFCGVSPEYFGYILVFTSSLSRQNDIANAPEMLCPVDISCLVHTTILVLLLSCG